MDHVGIVDDDLDAATAFFRELGLVPQGDGTVVVTRLQAQGAELVGEVVDYEDDYRPRYIRGPAGVITRSARSPHDRPYLAWFDETGERRRL